MTTPPLEPLPGAGTAPTPPSLFDAVGGREGVRRVVERFYALVEADALLRPIFPADLSAGREKQVLFFEQWLGGEPHYSERYGHPRLRRRHFPFVIDERAAGRWLALFTRAMREHDVPESAVARILEGLGPLAHHMVNANDDIPREPLGDARLT
ncbi:MAG: truncated hemoglobin [Chloroflexi bacterium]|nr:truncated hemoglobin [Chloroflexota bacterium]